MSGCQLFWQAELSTYAFTIKRGPIQDRRAGPPRSNTTDSMIYKHLLKENLPCSFHLLMFSGELPRGSLIALGFESQTRDAGGYWELLWKARRWLKRTQSVCRQTSSQTTRQSITNEVWNRMQRATWVTGVKFSPGEEDYKNANCCSNCETQLFGGGNECRSFHDSTLRVPNGCNRRHAAEHRVTCVVVQLHLLLDLWTAGCVAVSSALARKTLTHHL